MSTPNLDLETVPTNSLQPSVPINLSLQALDALVQLAVESETSTPPTLVAGDAGKRYLVGAAATGVWSGQDEAIALWTGLTWVFYAPAEGWFAYDRGANALKYYDGSAWAAFSSGSTFTGGALTSALNEAKGADIASAATTDIGAATGNFVHVTGTTTITALGTVQAGTRRIVRFAGALTLTHNATSLILPTGANINTAANDCAVFVSEGSGNWRCVGYQRADGSALLGGGGGSLTNWTESVSTAAPNATVPAVKFAATNAATNVDAVIAPKGTGAVLTATPDNTGVGGNKRGTRAVDLQTDRNTNTQVASGASSTVGGGQNNTASNSYATVPGGRSNVASGLESFATGAQCTASGAQSFAAGASCSASAANSVAIGSQCTADGIYSVATGQGGNARALVGARSHGIATGKQHFQLLLIRSTTNATASELTTTGAAASAANQFIVPGNRACVVRGRVVARNTSTGASKAWTFDALVKNIANVTSLEAAVTPTVIAENAGATTWTIAVTADDANDVLKVTATGAAATSIEWVCYLESIET